MKVLERQNVWEFKRENPRYDLFIYIGKQISFTQHICKYNPDNVLQTFATAAIYSINVTEKKTFY